MIRTVNTDVSGSYSYATAPGLSIIGGNDGTVVNAGQINPSLSTPGTYTVRYTFTNFVCSDIAETTVIIYSQPQISVQPSVNPVAFCLGGAAAPLTVTANGVGGATISNYEWFSNTSASTTGAISVGSGPALSAYTPLTTSLGTLYYYCVVTDNHGCSTSSNFSGPVTVNPPIADNTIYGLSLQLCSTEPIDELPGSQTNRR